MIEVSLFLAISASLIVLTLGLAQLVDRQRFQDTMITLRGTFQAQYEEVRAGINSRIGSSEASGLSSCGNTNEVAGKSAKCLTIGKLLRFAPGDTVKISYVVMQENDALRGTTDLEKIKNAALFEVETNDAGGRRQDVKIDWGGEIVGGFSVGNSRSQDVRRRDNLLLIRSPQSGAMLMFTNVNTPERRSAQTWSRINLGDAKNTENLALIIKNAGGGLPGAAVCIDAGASSSNVRLKIPASGINMTNPLNTRNNLNTICLDS